MKFSTSPLLSKTFFLLWVRTRAITAKVFTCHLSAFIPNISWMCPNFSLGQTTGSTLITRHHLLMLILSLPRYTASTLCLRKLRVLAGARYLYWVSVIAGTCAICGSLGTLIWELFHTNCIPYFFVPTQ